MYFPPSFDRLEVTNLIIVCICWFVIMDSIVFMLSWSYLEIRSISFISDLPCSLDMKIRHHLVSLFFQETIPHHICGCIVYLLLCPFALPLANYRTNFSTHLLFSYIENTYLILQLQNKTSFERCTLSSVLQLRIKALFWGPRKAVEPVKVDPSIGDFSLMESGSKVFIFCLK